MNALALKNTDINIIMKTSTILFIAATLTISFWAVVGTIITKFW